LTSRLSPADIDKVSAGIERKNAMRVIEKKMLTAIHDGKNINLGNTRVVSAGDYRRVYLFNNLISELDMSNGYITVYTMRKSATTKSRLNSILRNFTYPSISQTNWVWSYADGIPCGTDRTFGVHDLNCYRVGITK